MAPNDPTRSEELGRLISASLDGDLTETERRLLDDRLAQDPILAAEVERWRRLDRLLKATDRVVVDPTVFLDEHRRRRASSAEPRPWIRHLRWVVPAAAAAAILIAIGLWPAVPEPRQVARTAEPQPPTVEVLYAHGTVPAPGATPIVEVRYSRREDPGLRQPEDTGARPPGDGISFAVVSAGGWRPEATREPDVPPI